MRWSQSDFKLKPQENGKVLSIHNTMEENGNIVRVRMVAASFDTSSTILVTIDNRAVISVFNFEVGKFHILDEFIPRPTFIAPLPSKAGRKGGYFVGTKSGSVCHLDTQSAGVTYTRRVTSNRVENISFPKQSCPLEVCLINSRQEAFIVERDNLESKQRLQLSDQTNPMKYISFVPNTETIVICFENDTIEIQQGGSCPRNRHPIRDRAKQLRNAGQCAIGDKDGEPSALVKDFSRGLINSMSFSSDGKNMCLTTLDQFILILSTSTFDITKIVNVTDNTLKETCFLSASNSLMLIGLTMRGDVVLIDVNESEIKGIIHRQTAHKINTSPDGKMLYMILDTGEVDVYMVDTILNYIQQMQESSAKMIEQGRAGKVQGRDIDPNIRDMITQKKLKDYLSSVSNYGYPEEYRNVIWCVLLQLPVNKDTFLDLKSQQEHPVVNKFGKKLAEIGLPGDEAQRLKDLVSHLANWSPIFAEVDYIPGLVYPFLKVFPNSQLLTFEIVATILLNYGQLWFEFHPLEPYNFLGMCENVLMLVDTGLASFYNENNITAHDYAWPLIKTSFSQVFCELHWYTLWDTIVSYPPYFVVFLIIAFNTVNRSHIMKIQCLEEITAYFTKMNSTNVKRIIKAAHELDEGLPLIVHPKKFYLKFIPMPKYYYPVFDNYPKEGCDQDQDVFETFKIQIAELTKQEKDLNANYDVMLEKLDEELRNTENAKQTRNIDKWYTPAIKKDITRISQQKAMLDFFKADIKKRRARITNFLKEQHEKQQCDRGIGGQDLHPRLSMSDSEIDIDTDSSKKQHKKPPRSSKSETKLLKKHPRQGHPLNSTDNPSGMGESAMDKIFKRKICYIEKMVEEIQKDLHKVIES